MREIKLSLGILLICLLLTLTSCFGYGNVYKERSSGYFRYMVNDDNEAMLVGLTEEGQEQETLIIPSAIDGYNLTTIGYPVTVPPGKTIQYEIDMKSDKLKELYIPSSISKSNIYAWELYEGLPNIEVAYCGGIENTAYEYHYYNDNFIAFISNDNKELNINKYDVDSNGKLDFSHLMIANVVYYLNDDTEGSYFVDDCNNEKIVNIPSDSIRDGYEFIGWYKEKECINKWDFNSDIVPLKEYDSNNEYIFKETSLYAKWERR